eukprot:jgi/Psemu1/299453/fgenesh1_pm.1526_\
MALWSCVLGYCEALSTHRDDDRRYRIFPLPMQALERLAVTEFRSRILDPAAAAAAAAATPTPSATTPTPTHSAAAVRTVGTTANASAAAAAAAAAAVRDSHRSLARAVANAVWDTAGHSSKKDEEHANSLYVCLRGKVDRKSLDCLGASVATVAGLKILQEEDDDDDAEAQNAHGVGRARAGAGFRATSMLTLSEDHAYETHVIEVDGVDVDADADADKDPITIGGTCEVAIPGSTKRQKAKRACEIADTFKDKGGGGAGGGGDGSVLLTPETSWLYMANNSVVCDTIPMSLVPIVANVNCTIRSSKPSAAGSNNSNNHNKGVSLESYQLYVLKRELLWVLYDCGAMDAFPFGKMELADCEHTVGSERGERWVRSSLVSHGEAIPRNEELFLEAIRVSKELYGDAQVYPYYYAGHYHKDAGNEPLAEEQQQQQQQQQREDGNDGETNNNNNNNNGNNNSGNSSFDNEHRFVDALTMYAEAARVTSRYRFDTGDCLQLNKHLTTVAALIQQDILTTASTAASVTATATATGDASKPRPREWKHTSNAVASCASLLRFLDHLLFWEEWSLAAATKAGVTSKNPRFVEILQVSHKSFLGRLFQSFGADVRREAWKEFVSRDKDQKEEGSGPRSKRLANPRGLLATALQKPRVNIRDMDLAILEEDDGESGSGRRKRRRRG